MSTLQSLVTSAIFMLAGVCALAGEYSVESPDGRIEFAIVKEDGKLVGRVDVGKRNIVERLPLAITINGQEYPGQAAIENVDRRHVKMSIEPTIPTITDKIKKECREMLLHFGAPIALRVRAFNDGIALRWESSIESEEIVVDAENFELQFSQDFKVYYPIPQVNNFHSHQECTFEYRPVSQTADLVTASTPVLLDIGRGVHMLLSDVNVSGYPGLWIEGNENGTIKGIFPPYPLETKYTDDRNSHVVKQADYIAKTNGKREFPWRALVIADAEGLLKSTMLYTLADPSRIEDTSWIEPGKVAWDWWNKWNITDVDFAAGINQATYKNYIDFAAANSLDYVILDEGWSQKGAENLLNVVPELDIPELVEYARARDVEIILWMTMVALEQNFDAAFRQFDEWGIKGLKVDFMQRDDQLMMDLCERFAQTAAEHELLVDFHGGSKPTGLQRTYPNVLTHESVVGLEHSKWSHNANPEMAVLHPFIRMVVGPMDYTPGAMDNFSKDEFKPNFGNPGSQGTRCHQLAMYVVYVSPLQMLADTPTKYRRNPESMQFLRRVPTTWEENVVLNANVGEHVAVARRHGEEWFIGAMTDWQARELEVALDFLGKGDHTLRYWADGAEAAAEPTDLATGKKTVDRSTKLKLKLAPGGGYAAIITPAE